MNKITVLQEDFDKAVKANRDWDKYVCSCLVAQTIKRVLGTNNVVVEPRSVCVDGRWRKGGKSLEIVVNNFDAFMAKLDKGKVKENEFPLSFPLDFEIEA